MKGVEADPHDFTARIFYTPNSIPRRNPARTPGRCVRSGRAPERAYVTLCRCAVWVALATPGKRSPVGLVPGRGWQEGGAKAAPLPLHTLPTRRGP